MAFFFGKVKKSFLRLLLLFVSEEFALLFCVFDSFYLLVA
jgi:hypothetical protein